MSYIQSVAVTKGEILASTKEVCPTPAIRQYPVDTPVSLWFAEQRGSALISRVPSDHIPALTQDVAALALGCYAREHISLIEHKSGEISKGTVRGILNFLKKVDYISEQRLIVVGALDPLIGAGEEDPTQAELEGIDMLQSCLENTDSPAIIATTNHRPEEGTMHPQRERLFASFGKILEFAGTGHEALPAPASQRVAMLA